MKKFEAKGKKLYSVYLLECADGTLYTGSTNNLKKRLRMHNTPASGAKYTRSRRPVKLVFSEGGLAFGQARSREAEIKRMTRKQKLDLLQRK